MSVTKVRLSCGSGGRVEEGAATRQGQGRRLPRVAGASRADPLLAPVAFPSFALQLTPPNCLSLAAAWSKPRSSLFFCSSRDGAGALGGRLELLKVAVARYRETIAPANCGLWSDPQSEHCSVLWRLRGAKWGTSGSFGVGRVGLRWSGLHLHCTDVHASLIRCSPCFPPAARAAAGGQASVGSGAADHARPQRGGGSVRADHGGQQAGGRRRQQETGT